MRFPLTMKTYKDSLLYKNSFKLDDTNLFTYNGYSLNFINVFYDRDNRLIDRNLILKKYKYFIFRS